MISIKSKYIFKLIGFFIFFYILTLADYNKIWYIFDNANISFIFLSIFIALLSILIKCKRWQYINRIQSIDIPFFKIFKIFTIAIALGQITPGRLGEFVKIRSIKKYTPDSIKRWSSVVIDRIHDVIILLFFGLISLFFIKQIELNYSYIIIFLFIIGILLFLLIKKYGEVCLDWFIDRLVNQEINISIKNRVKGIKNNTIKTFKDSFYKSFCYSLVSFIVQCLITTTIVFSIGESIPFYIIIFVLSVSALASLIPITIGGLGTREGVYIYLFSQYGIPMETSLVIAFIDGVLIFTLFICMLAFTFWAMNQFSIEF